MNNYLVALRTGGEMGDPDISYNDFQIIKAENKLDACKRYNQINNCSYFYGEALALVRDKVSVEKALTRRMNIKMWFNLFSTGALEGVDKKESQK
ncbi:hypothetical protein P7D15_00775 [Bacillus cereus]|uniref:Uncharacterized protein n=2 Tax=Bacillus cereus group TaxID=86661 RepID=A0A9X0SPB3_BACCE|nr:MULTISPECIES: hypothetical protein [Bacillus cereus group]KXY51017.1 hypothetical protein AT268_31230 [Bacillus cereus]MDF9598981.1 hypothetical protein [Bacillus cereus]MDG1589314.1 hypothetical protein [Bacillus cereus]MEC3272627.1 hypothetical protein [Bacillus thuringiensis]PFB09120.1 hypothetical protein CN398_05655 [Bacillus thuringiensis]